MAQKIKFPSLENLAALIPEGSVLFQTSSSEG
jgi:hypothetical protein